MDKNKMNKNPLYAVVKLFCGLIAIASSTLNATEYQQGYSPAPQIENVEQLITRFSLRENKTASNKNPLWKKPKKVVVWRSLKQFDQLENRYPEIKFVKVNIDNFADEISDADVFIGYCVPAIKSIKTNLAFIQSMAVGVENCAASEDLTKRKVMVSNIKSLSGPEISEHAIALMMALTRGLDVYQRAQVKQQWTEDLLPANDAIWELEGRTMLVVGLGGIGTEVARRAHGLGMKVIATRNSRRSGPDYVSYVGLANELNQLAEKADVVINTVPLTEQTQGIFNTAFFKAMPKHGYFISVGRGKSTNTSDLLSALKNGDIAGAGLDVMDPEPLPQDHPLWVQPRVIITPHMAARSDKYRDRVWLLVEENFRRYVNGEPVLSPVNLQAGY